MKSMKITLVLSMAILLALGAVAWAKESPPDPGPMKKLSFPKYKEFTLKNGLEVVVVEHSEQPVASIWLAIRAGSTLDPNGQSSLAQYTASLLNKGTTSKNSDELAEWIESKGGSFSANAGDDYTVITLSILSEYVDVAYEYIAHLINEATFPEDELEKERKRVKTALEFQLSDPNSMADRHFKQVVYGHHPYAIQPTVESVEAVMHDDVVAFHARNYVANNAVMFVVGDVKSKQVKKAAKKNFGDWRQGTPDQVEYPNPPERTARNISLYHRPGSVQTNLYVGHLGLRPNNPDWARVTVANRVLGAGATGRLFMTLREEKGWTYGAYSRFTREVDVGYFRATANVRTEVTDSALTEILAQVQRMVDEPVSDEELADAQSYLIGNFPTTIETPSQIASQVGQVKLLGLDKKHLENYRKEIAKVTVEDVQVAMQTYLHPDRLAIVAVGDAADVRDVLMPIASVALYDIEGTPMSPDELSVEGTDYAFDSSSLKDFKAVYSVKVQDAIELGDMETSLTRTGDSFAAHSKLDGMILIEEELSFGAEKFEPLSYRFHMSAMGQEMKAEYTFTDGTATGHIEGGKEEGPRDVSVKLVEGCVVSGALEYVIATLPLGETRSYKFPSLDTQSGKLENVRITVEGEEDLLVPAGSFATYKVRVRRGEGEQVFYVQKAFPHLIIKQEVPAQQLKIELKSLEM